MNFLKANHKTLAFLFLIWFGATVLNLTKSIHIDDTAYLEIVRHIVHAPLHPMSGFINWYESPQPIRTLLHPPLIPYLYALALFLFGESEIILHLVFSLFTLIAMVFFYLLAKFIQPQFALLLTAMFALGPAFLPSQNLMTDVPMVALWIAFFWAII